MRAASALSEWTELAAPDAAAGTAATWHVALGGPSAAPPAARLRLAFVFSNASDARATALAARALADAWDAAWADARADWQARFDSAFDPARPHFSGVLPTMETTSGGGSGGPGFDSAAERMYYAGVVGLLANERTNYPPSLPHHGGAGWREGSARSGGGVCGVYDDDGDDLELAESFDLHARAGTAARRGLGCFLEPFDLGRGRSGVPRVRGCGFSGGGADADFAGGAGVSRQLELARNGHHGSGEGLEPRALLREAGAPWRMFMTGGGMNATTNIFYWDYQYFGDLLAMLEPLTLARQLLLWTSSVDADSDEVSSWSFWGYDYAAQRGVGNYYAMNDATLFDVLASYLRVSGDLPFLNTSYLVGPFANGSFASTTVVATALGLATHWKAQRYNVSGALADYGEAANLLECVPTYIHRVAGVNAANSYMSGIAADVAERWLGDAPLAAQLRADADAVAAAVLGSLYVAPGTGANGSGGYFRALYPNGTARDVRSSWISCTPRSFSACSALAAARPASRPRWQPTWRPLRAASCSCPTGCARSRSMTARRRSATAATTARRAPTSASPR